MRTNYFNIQLIGLFMLSLIPWPGPMVFKISCPRDNARIVRKIIQSKWIPVLEKYKVSIPLECPFHPQRDIFGPQQSAKHQHRPSQWTCGFCGKSFFEEKFLDMHFDNRHKSNVNMAEDAVCLSDYCDIMRCNVLVTQDAKIAFPESVNTDIEIWREATAYRTALATSGPRELARYTVREGSYTQKQSPTVTTATPAPEKPLCEKTDAPETPENSEDSPAGEKSQNGSSPCQSDLVDAALPAADFKQQRILELQKLKANCKPDELQKLKTRCEILVRDCIASLLIQLSINDFKEVEDELNKAVCWYLTCDRYWEDSQTEGRVFPWGLLFMIVMVLSLGICLCYYIIWVLFDSDDISVTSASVTDTSTPSPAHTLRGQSSTASNSLDVPHQQVYTEDYYTASDKDLGQNEHYIYVTYPPDLKRRLLERGCLDGLGFAPTVQHIPRENPIQLDTAYMGYEVVIVKGGQRVCGSGGALGNAPLVQSKSYFEVKIQQGGSWAIGLATRQTNLSLTQGGMDEYCWALCSDNAIRNNKQELYRLNTNSVSNSNTEIQACEGDIVGVSYDHIQLKFYLNGKELECPVTNVKGTVYPALYVDDGAILDIILENFNFSAPAGFEKIMLEQSLL